jgi:hypothetical protein
MPYPPIDQAAVAPPPIDLSCPSSESAQVSIVSVDPPQVHGRLALSRAVQGWAAGSNPLYLQLAAAIRAGLATGAIGDHLPSERDLAAELAVSRTTAVAAYDVLVAEGVVVRRAGSGTVAAKRAGAADVCDDPHECLKAFFES